MPETLSPRQTQSPEVLGLLGKIEKSKDADEKASYLRDLLGIIQAGDNWKIAAANFKSLEKHLEDYVCFAESIGARPSTAAAIIASLGAKGCDEATGFGASLMANPENRFANAFALELSINKAQGYFASNYAVFRNASINSISDPMVQILMHEAFDASKSKALRDDMVKFIYEQPRVLANSPPSILPVVLNDSSLKEIWFKNILAAYSGRASMGFSKYELSNIKDAIEAALDDPALMGMAFQTRDAEIGKICVDHLEGFRSNPTEGNKQHYASFIQDAYSKALDGDLYYLSIVSYMQERGFDSPKKLLKDNFFAKILPGITGDSGWAYATMAKDCLAEFDWGFYKKVFGKMNEMYEKGETEGPSKLIGVMTAESGAISPPDIGFLKKLEIAAYLLSSGGITKKMFGSVGAILSLSKGNVPVGRVLNLVSEDEKARTFALISLSAAVDYTLFREQPGYGFKLKQEDVGIGLLDEAVEKTLKEMGKKDMERFSSMLNDEKIRAEALGNPKTNAGATYLLRMFDYFQEEEAKKSKGK